LLSVVSNPVEIEILPAKAEEPPWGEPVADPCADAAFEKALFNAWKIPIQYDSEQSVREGIDRFENVIAAFANHPQVYKAKLQLFDVLRPIPSDAGQSRAAGIIEQLLNQADLETDVGRHIALRFVEFHLSDAVNEPFQNLARAKEVIDALLDRSKKEANRLLRLQSERLLAEYLVQTGDEVRALKGVMDTLLMAKGPQDGSWVREGFWKQLWHKDPELYSRYTHELHNLSAAGASAVETADDPVVLEMLKGWPPYPVDGEDPLANAQFNIYGLAWGQVVDGLQLGLSLDHKDGVYRQGDLVRLTAYLRNAGNTEQTVTYYLQHDDDYKAPPGQQTLRDSPYLTNSKGKPVPLRPRLRGANIVTDQELVLQPGQTRPLGKVRLAIAPLPEHRPAEYFAKLKLGMYRISQKVNFRTRRTRGLATDVLQLHTSELELVVEPAPDVPWTQAVDGLEFLAEIPEFRALRLDITERRLRLHIRQHSLAVRFHERGDETTYHLYTPEGENVIVMFRDGHCAGIQRMRPDRQTALKLFQEKRTNDQKAFSAYNQTCRFLYEGGDRVEAAKRFGEVAKLAPVAEYGASARELAVFLKQMAAEQRPAIDPPNLAGGVSISQHIENLIFDLRDVAVQAISVPGKCWVLLQPTISPKSSQPNPAHRLRQLAKSDDASAELVVSRLMQLLTDRRPTRSWSGAKNGGHVLRYCDVALEILADVADARLPNETTAFDPRTARDAYLGNADEQTSSEIIARINTQWARRRNWPNPNPADPPTDTRFKHFSPRELFPYVLGNKSINVDGTIGTDDCRVACAWFIWKTRNTEDGQTLRGTLADRIVEKVRDAQKDPSKSYHDCFIWAQFLGPLGAREQALLLLKESPPKWGCHPGPTFVEALAMCGTIEDVPALIDAIDKESEGSGPIINKTLYKLTGVYMPLNERGYTDKAAWQKWWQQQQKTDVEDETARERVSQMVGAALPESVENGKVFSAAFEDASVVLCRFDIPKQDLKVLLEKSKRLPEFSGFVKTPELESRWAKHRYSEVDWWRPDELKEPAYGEWRAAERALGGEGKVWVVQFVDIACGELANALMRVYLQNRSHGHTIED
jgi:hypothetical protein